MAGGAGSGPLAHTRRQAKREQRERRQPERGEPRMNAETQRNAEERREKELSAFLRTAIAEIARRLRRNFRRHRSADILVRSNALHCRADKNVRAPLVAALPRRVSLRLGVEIGAGSFHEAMGTKRISGRGGKRFASPVVGCPGYPDIQGRSRPSRPACR